MSGIFDAAGDAATPLTEEEKRDLIPSYIANRSELNAAEQENIARGLEWGLLRPRKLLDEKFIKDLHRHMLGDVWRWAGTFRKSPRNIGVAHWEIPVKLRMLLDDVKTWIESKSYSPDEIAVRLHHRMAHIHPFANGNGRHTRLMADLLAIQLGGTRFSWGGGGLASPGVLRKRYIDALQAADNHDYGPLLAFARS